LSAKVCKTAFLILHRIKESRQKKIYRNRSDYEDRRGKHHSHYKIPLEIEDIREFIENDPSRESHYSPSVKTGRKYIESTKNISILFNEFIEKFYEYKTHVNYHFFYHIF
jgi:hypothetical protein